MSISQLNPIIENISVNKTANATDPSISYGERQVTSYELDRIGSSFGTIILNGTVHHLKENDIFFRKPGQHVEGIMPYRYQYVTFTLFDATKETIALLDALPDKLHLNHATNINRIFDEIQYLFFSEDEMASLPIKAKLLELLYEFYLHARKAKYNRHIKNAIGYIEAHYDEQIRIEDIASHIGISSTYLFQQFKKALNSSPMAYLNQLRLNKGKSLLLDSNLSIMEIAMACGFGSAAYFDYVFKQSLGLTPTDFRDRYVNKQ